MFGQYSPNIQMIFCPPEGTPIVPSPELRIMELKGEPRVRMREIPGLRKSSMNARENI